MTFTTSIVDLGIFAVTVALGLYATWLAARHIKSEPPPPWPTRRRVWVAIEEVPVLSHVFFRGQVYQVSYVRPESDGRVAITLYGTPVQVLAARGIKVEVIDPDYC